jgi:hypothetical protein
VRLEHAGEPDAVPLAFVEVLLDRIRGIDDRRNSGVLVADEVRGTPEAVVDELLEEHDCDATSGCGYIS